MSLLGFPLDQMHPLIAGLFRMLPDEDESFPAKKRRQWLAAARVNLALIWGEEDEDDDDGSATSSQVFSK